MRGVFLDLDSMNPADLDLDRLRESLDDWQFHPQTPPDLVGERIAGADVVVSNKVPLVRDSLLAADTLKLVCVAATGTNNIDLQVAGEAGIAVSNARNYATTSVTEAVFAMLLTLVRRLDDYRARVSAGDWPASPHFCLFDKSIGELSDKTLGIVGHGVLGRAVEQVARSFGMRVVICQRLHAEPETGRTPLGTLLTEADVISLHCPLTAETRNLIGRPQLQAMKPGAILINTARGGIVDEAALAEALEHGWIAGAGVDVLVEEPPVSDNPLLACRSPHLILTPHIAWASQAARQRLVNEIIENIHAFRRGQARNRVV